MARERSFRRHQARLAKHRAYDFLKYRWGIEDPTPSHVGRFASTHCKPCSCLMCGNGRRVEGPTRQELFAEMSEREQITEGTADGQHPALNTGATFG
jgi:hypothetical protein